MELKKKIFCVIMLPVSFIVGYYGKAQFDSFRVKKQNFSRQVRMDEKDIGGYKFINPLLECEIGDVLQNSKLLGFKDRVANYINQNTDNGQINHASVYFRDLNNGPWFGFNESEAFFPASLTKVPLMIAYFKKREDHPNLFDEVLKYEKPFNTHYTPLTPPSKEIVVGESYPIGDLIERMIVYSDNEATALLSANIEPDFLTKVYGDLDIVISPTFGGDYVITTGTYASFFRVLFNASYLDQKDSEQALEILSRVEFRDGLKAGVSEEIVVAHKFGEREVFNDNEVFLQLHDCGIIYYPEHPYLLCIMTSGQDAAQLKKIIQGVSKFIYEDRKSEFKS